MIADRRQRWGLLMDRVSVDLRNCYGIKKLHYDFDFSRAQAWAIYAPNGVMKSSLAQTFKDASLGQPSLDRIFSDRETTRTIVDSAGNNVDGDRVLVVLPYDEEFGPTEKTSTLLVNSALRREYEQLHVAIEEARDALLRAIRQTVGGRRDFGGEIASAFTNNNDFDLAVSRIRDEVLRQKDAPFSQIKYELIFTDQVVNALNTPALKNAIEDYIKRYNQLLAASTYFRKGIFDYYNAGQIARTLASNGFFEAKHSVNLKHDTDVLEINTEDELEAVIAKEKDAILKDTQLRRTFDTVQRQLDRNAALRDFCHYLQDNETLLPHMNNLPKFKEDVLKSYIKDNESLYNSLMEKYDAAAKRTAEIEEEARKQRTQWEETIAIFNGRFFVPFQLEARNRVEVMLGNEEIIDLGFTYIDGNDKAEVGKRELLQVLSTGERKALYVLNVIFEVQRRIKDGQETLIVVDDIADSFDYQNKYAIIQYLQDISREGQFKLIIMTHNFDFFRTLESRFVGYSRCLMASKDDTETTLVQATGIRNVFANDWKGAFFDNAKKKIASIPFLRNLIEMTVGEADRAYERLTAMLHWKVESSTITVGELDAIYNQLCQTSKASTNPAELVCDLIAREAKSCASAPQAGLNLENKIVLAVGIRIAAERFMVDKINDAPFVASIQTNQTQRLITRYRQDFAVEVDNIAILDRVALMTPENIHVNSFMYEPIVDMSDDHLKRLYADVTGLS